MTIECEDTAGEYFDNLSKSSGDNNFFDDCALASGLLLLIDGTSTSNHDQGYSNALTVLQEKLSSRLVISRIKVEEYRIAVVLSKADQPKVWNSLSKLEKIFQIYFPRTQSVLQEWNNLDGFSIEYFACSAYGMLGDSFKPNARQSNYSSDYSIGWLGVIINKSGWRPFGLVAPIYWLCTGKIDPRLQEFTSNKRRNFIKLLLGFILLVAAFAGTSLVGISLFNLIFQKPRLPTICTVMEKDMEQQIKNLKDLPQKIALHPNCQKKLNQLLYETGRNAAKNGNLPIAVDRFCQISNSSDEEFRSARSLMNKWRRDSSDLKPHVESHLEVLKEQQRSCPVATEP